MAGLGDLEASQLSLLSALVGALGQASEGTGVGALSEAMIEGLNGSIVARSLGEDIGAVVVTEAKANLGLIRLELRKLPGPRPRATGDGKTLVLVTSGGDARLRNQVAGD